MKSFIITLFMFLGDEEIFFLLLCMFARADLQKNGVSSSLEEKICQRLLFPFIGSKAASGASQVQIKSQQNPIWNKTLHV